MSYDYHVLKLASEVTHVRDIETAMLPMGSWATVRDAIDHVVTGINWMAGLGSLQTERGWMEFRVTEGRDPSLGFTIHTSHRSDHTWEESVLRRLAAANNWSIVDGQTYLLMNASGDQVLERETEKNTSNQGGGGA